MKESKNNLSYANSIEKILITRAEKGKIRSKTSKRKKNSSYVQKPVIIDMATGFTEGSNNDMTRFMPTEDKEQDCKIKQEKQIRKVTKPEIKEPRKSKRNNMKSGSYLTDWLKDEMKNDPNFIANFTAECMIHFPRFHEWIKNNKRREVG